MSQSSVMYYRDRNWDGFFNSPEYSKVVDMEGNISTMDMYDSPYFGSLTGGAFGQAMDLAFEDFQMRIQNQPTTATPKKSLSILPIAIIGALFFVG